MPAWVSYTRKRFAYTGRITRAPFTAWTETTRGRAAVEEVAAAIRLAPFGRTWAARRRLWRQLATAARAEAVVEAIQTEAELYLGRLGGLVYSDGLPRETVQLRRVVIVPTVLLNGDAYGALDLRLGVRPEMIRLEGGAALRQFFLLRVISDLDAVVRRAAPTPKNPLSAGPDWMTVGVNHSFEWLGPALNQPAWSGHHYVVELTREPFTRAARKAVEAAVARFEAALPGLSRLERNDILRRARYVA
jgi:hypothetical protein